ncbi:aspartic proteinase CDR1-like [Gossypium australe]|uniref:Aspartic proteinase CDR1-like n=1 Tax=Gossypium australe TaxID=47621 RepID=A0A5B6WRU1_9ROSI|nr:aspartic proteinase CDR1-like [Gossypium australe]
MARIGNDPDREDLLHPNSRDTDIPRVIDDRDRPIRELLVPILDDLNPRIVRPQIQAQHFELKPVMFQMLQIKQWHLGMKFVNFFLQYNPPNMNAKLRNDTTSFWKSEDETLYEAWERFKESTTRVGTGRRVVGAMELVTVTSLTTQLSSLTNMIKTLKRLAVVQEMKAMGLTVVYCGSQAASLRALENQMGQITSALSLRPQGALPRDTENSRSQGEKHCKAIKLRSGTQLPGVVNDAAVKEDS